MAEATQSILLLHVTGEDRPGITAALTKILGEQRIEILDINQTVIHKTLTEVIISPSDLQFPFSRWACAARPKHNPIWATL